MKAIPNNIAFAIIRIIFMLIWWLILQFRKFELDKESRSREVEESVKNEALISFFTIHS